MLNPESSLATPPPRSLAGPGLASARPNAEAATPPGSNLVEICLRRKWTVAAVTLVCLGVAIAYLSLATKLYTSSSRLYVEQNGPQLLAQSPVNLLDGNEAYLLRQCEVIKAESILREALNQNPGEVLLMYRGVADPLTELEKNLTVDVGKKDQVISVELTSPFPVQSARLVNSIVQCYQTFISQQTQSSAAQALLILQREKDKQDQLLDEKLKEVVDFKQKNGEMFFTTGQGVNILTQNLATISDQLTKARLNAISIRVMASQQNNRMQANQMAKEAAEQVVEFEHEFDMEKEKALKINSAEAEYQKMQAEVDRTNKLCDLLDTRIKELNVTENGGSMNIRVLDTAKPEEHPTHPKKTMTLLAALAAGLVLGSGLAVVHDRLDQRIDTPDEVTRMLAMPVLGAIPTARDMEPGNRSQVGSAVYTSPRTAFADAHLALGMAIHVDWPENAARTLLVTSPGREDGKSMVCSNLAITMAQTGRKTLLIDADLRRPVQHDIFCVSNVVGMTDVLTRGMRVEHTVQHSNIEGLSLLTCGELPLNPAELISGPAFARMLQRLEEQYELILIDAPPITLTPDARILGAQADLALLVLRAGSSTRQDAEQAHKRLRGVGAHVLGVVLNHVRGRLPAHEEERSFKDASSRRSPFRQSRRRTDDAADPHLEGERALTY